MLAPAGDARPQLRSNPRRAEGPPWLYGYPLYDWRNEELHDLIDGFSLQLDEATELGVLLSCVGNPRHTGPVYEVLRSPEIEDRDAADAKAYFERLEKGGGAAYDRRRQVRALAAALKVPADQFPCIAFLAYPLSLPVGLFRIKPEWISTREAQVQFATALEVFFKSRLNLQALLRGAPTNVRLVKSFERYINGWFACRESGMSAFRSSAAASRISRYCRAITDKSVRNLTRDAYEELVTQHKRYDLFIDSITGVTWHRRPGASKILESRLTSTEAEMIADYIIARKPLRPADTPVARALSLRAPIKMFESARRKMDIKLGHQAFQVFHARRPGNAKLKCFEFSPPPGMTYCLIRLV